MCCVIFFCIPTKQPFIQVGPACFFFFFFFLHLFPFFWWLTLIEAVGTWWATRDPARTIIIRSPFSSPLNFVFFFLYIYFFLYRVNLHDGNEIEDEEFPLLAVAHVCCVGSLLLFVSRNEIDAGGRLHLNASRARGLNIELDVLLGGGNKTLSLSSVVRSLYHSVACVCVMYWEAPTTGLNETRAGSLAAFDRYESNELYVWEQCIEQMLLSLCVCVSLY